MVWFVITVAAVTAWAVAADAPVQSVGPSDDRIVAMSMSMAHCEQLGVPDVDRCEPTGGTYDGMISPGDLLEVRRVATMEEVETRAQDGRERFGAPGDVLAFSKPDGGAIIHRAMFWLEIRPDGGYDIPDLGLTGLQNLTHPTLNAPPYRVSPGLHDQLVAEAAGAEDSGFITRGDNNLVADQGINPSIGPMPVTMDRVFGVVAKETPIWGIPSLQAAGMLAPAGDVEVPEAELERYWSYVIGAIVGDGLLLLAAVAGSILVLVRARRPAGPQETPP